MKLLCILFIASLSSSISAQVGINNENPNATLDVQINRNSLGEIIDNSQFHGIQAPRLTRNELTKNTARYGKNQNGTLIYITDISEGEVKAGTQHEFITMSGYYHFDAVADRWLRIVNNNTEKKYSSNNGLTTDKEGITTLGGDLNKATVINQANFPIIFNATSGLQLNTTGESQTSIKITHPLYTKYNNQGILITGAAGTPALNQSSFIAFNPNAQQGTAPILVGASYVNSATSQASADFIVASTSTDARSSIRFIVANNGFVGINTTKPRNALDVNGTVRTRYIRTDYDDANSWPDLVFESDYKLPPLEEIKVYIDKNKHLPEIPSETEVKNEGSFDMGKMQITLLKKVEELTLYVIQQNEKIKEQEARIQELEK